MRILFAAPDRDLLSAYSRLLSDVETETDTAFDGTQAAVKLETEKWDLLILSRDIPRLGWTKILELCRELSVPVILLSGRQTGAGEPGKPAADAYLTMPFTPDELKALADKVGKKGSGSAGSGGEAGDGEPAGKAPDSEVKDGAPAGKAPDSEVKDGEPAGKLAGGEAKDSAPAGKPAIGAHADAEIITGEGETADEESTK